MSAWAAPGVKCVCVVAGEVGPAVRDVCTVDEVKVDKDGVWLALVEYGWHHTDTATMIERRRPLFRVQRFRPLVSRTQEQDIAIFRPILTSTSVGEDA